MRRCVVMPESMKSSLGAGLGKPDLGNTHLPAHLSQLTHSITYSGKLSLTAVLPFPIILAAPHHGMDQGPLFYCPCFPPCFTLCAESLFACLDLSDSPFRQNVTSSCLCSWCLGQCLTQSRHSVEMSWKRKRKEVWVLHPSVFSPGLSPAVVAASRYLLLSPGHICSRFTQASVYKCRAGTLQS